MIESLRSTKAIDFAVAQTHSHTVAQRKPRQPL